MRVRTLLTFAALAFAAACTSETPTFVSPGAPAMDNGWLAGSGNRSGDTPPADTQPQSATNVVPCVPPNVDNGWLAGSGNDTAPICPEPTVP